MGRKTKARAAKKKSEKMAAAKAAAAEANDPFRTSSEGMLLESEASSKLEVIETASAQQTVTLPPKLQPTAMHLIMLPYVATLCPQHEDLHAMLLQEHRTAHSVAKCKALVKKVKDDRKTTEYDLAEPKQQLAIAQRAADEVEARVTRAIDKHYRVSSIKLHPDRVGEQARPAFEALTEARNCLRMVTSRRLYIDQMLDVVTDLRYWQAGAKEMGWDVVGAHKSWVERNPPSKFVEGNGNSKEDDDAGKSMKPLALTGGIANDTPRKPRIAILSLSDRLVRVSLPLPDNEYQFLQYCDSVHVVGDAAFLSDEATLATIDMDDPNAVNYGTVETTITIPEEGVWYIKWFARLNIDGRMVSTPRSYETTIDITSKETIKKMKEIVELCDLARHRTNDIKKTLRNLRGVTSVSGAASRMDLENKYWHLHSVLAKARSTYSRLLNLSKTYSSLSSPDSDAALSDLDASLEEAKPLKTLLDGMLSSIQKRDAMQNFKARIATIIEEGSGAEFLETTTPQRLVAMGGESNRLYQLLVEGKGKQYGALELDSSILAAAAKRNDMFSTKQMKALEERKVEAENVVQAEMARNKAEAEGKAKIEAERRAAEDRALRQKKFLADERKAFTENSARLADERRGLGVGAVVKIDGLKNAQVRFLNGTTATIKGRSSAFGDTSGHDRFHIICHETGEVKSVLAKNLVSLVGVDDDEPDANGMNANPAAPPNTSVTTANRDWTCDVCTYLHQGDLVWNTKCSMCETPRGGSIPPPHRETNARPAQQQQHQEPARPQALVQNSAPKKTLKQKIVVAPLTPAALSKISAVPSPSSMASRRSGGSGATSTTAGGSKKERKARYCRDGAKCRFLPDRCNFYHTSEEIKAARAAHKPSFVKKTALISPSVVGCVIGHGGTHIQKIHRDTKCNIWIDQESMAAHEMRIVDISGHPDMVDLAIEMIKDLVYEFGHRDDFRMKEQQKSTSVAKATPTPAKAKPTPAKAKPTTSTTPTPTAASTPAPAISASNTPASASSPSSASPPALTTVPVTSVSKPVAAVVSTKENDAVPARVEVNTDVQSVVSEPSISTAMPQQLQQQQPQSTVASGLSNHQRGITGVPLGRGNPIGGVPIGGVPLASYNINITGNNDTSNLQELVGSSLLLETPMHMQQPPLQQSPGRDILQGLRQYEQQPQKPQPQAPLQPTRSVPQKPTSPATTLQGTLLAFLDANKGFIKGSPADFCNWLAQNEDIHTLADLADAVEDDDYLRDVLQKGDGSVGVKGFKRIQFRKEAKEAAKKATESSRGTGGTDRVISGGSSEVSGGSSNNAVASELICPISHVLMVNAPVIASDGYTYEESVIQAWFQRSMSEIEMNKQILLADPSNEKAKKISERGVLSPMTGNPLPNLQLIPNVNIRKMANDAHRQGGGEW